MHCQCPGRRGIRIVLSLNNLREVMKACQMGVGALHKSMVVGNKRDSLETVSRTV